MRRGRVDIQAGGLTDLDDLAVVLRVAVPTDDDDALGVLAASDLDVKLDYLAW